MKKLWIFVFVFMGWNADTEAAASREEALEYLQNVRLNPIGLGLARIFTHSEKAIQSSSGEGIVLNSSFRLDERLNCKFFHMLNSGSSDRNSEEATYHFKRSGNFVLENLLFENNLFQTHYFSSDAREAHELVGQDAEKRYFEYLRLDVDGSLVIELQTRERDYAAEMLKLLNASQYQNFLTTQDFRDQNLIRSGTVDDRAHMTIGYGYCPSTH